MSINTSLSEILNGDTSVTDSIDDFTYDGTTYSMIFNDALLPKYVKTGTPAAPVNLELTTDNKTIMFYNASSIPGSSPFIDTTYTLSCRAGNYADAETIQLACFSALKGVRSSDGCNFFVSTKEAIIPPRDENDNYNAVLSVRSMGPTKQL